MNERKRWTRVAAYGVVVRGGAILLCRLSLTTHTGMWTLPGGGLDFGEKPEAGMRREVGEETGLTVETCALLAVNSHTMDCDDGSELFGVQILYRATVEDAPLQFEADGTTDVCAWVPLSDVPGLPHVPLVAFALEQIAAGG